MVIYTFLEKSSFILLCKCALLKKLPLPLKPAKITSYRAHFTLQTVTTQSSTSPNDHTTTVANHDEHISFVQLNFARLRAHEFIFYWCRRGFHCHRRSAFI